MSKICCFTGRRELSSSAFSIMAHLESMVRRMVKAGFTDFRAGGAIGFDTIAALIVLKVKQDHPHIKLHLILPHKNHAKGFSKEEKAIFYYTLKHADTVVYTGERYTRSCYFVRNRALVDGADYCVAYDNSVKGGTAYTVRYAKRHKVPVYNLVRLR